MRPVRAGLLGKVVQIGSDKFQAMWSDKSGTEWTAELTTERDAVAYVAKKAAGGLRFRDLRRAYVTGSDGVPINDVARIIGHEQTSTTLDRYTNTLPDADETALDALASIRRR
jgi:integrase